VKSVVITGGTGGLGSIVVPRLEREYRCVLLTRAMADLSDEASVRDAFAQIGEIYALVHLAGGFAAGSVEETTGETWSHMLALNLTGAFHAMRAALPHLTRPGRIIAVSSIASIDKSAGLAAYAVSKSALNTLVEVLAKENHGIAANVLAPATLTDTLRKEVAETIAFLLSDAAASISGTIIPLRETA
jgi:NAD(P)-dependent dehydrogenase (short-subunit alcohol dehydrogenase family)